MSQPNKRRPPNVPELPPTKKKWEPKATRMTTQTLEAQGLKVSKVNEVVLKLTIYRDPCGMSDEDVASLNFAFHHPDAPADEFTNAVESMGNFPVCGLILEGM